MVSQSELGLNISIFLLLSELGLNFANISLNTIVATVVCSVVGVVVVVGL